MLRSICVRRWPLFFILSLALLALTEVNVGAADFGTNSPSFTYYNDVFCGNPILDPSQPTAPVQPERLITEPGLAAIVNVSIVKFSFDPPNAVVNIGDTVRWTNIDGSGHTTTGPSSLWASGTLQNGQSFSFTFTSAGSYTYHCSIHSAMTGNITVLGSTPTATPTSSNNPTLGNYSATSVPLSGDTTVIPDAAPTLSTRMIVSASSSFKGKLEADPVTGTVRVTNAHPAGTYGVRITSFESGGASTSKNFSLTVTTPPECNPVTFAPAVNYGVGVGARSVAVGDFNGDGNQDIASANDNANNVSVLLGNGAGGFGAATNIAVGFFPYSVAVGDFNGDGKQDLVAANEVSHNVSILLGNGAGGFGSATNFAAGTNPTAVVVGNFNGDGYQDLAVSHLGSTSVSVLLGNGAGTFAALTNYSIGVTSFSLALGDFNFDGKQDIATANRNAGTVSVLLGTGTGTFGAAANFTVGIEPASITVGDFNEDGKQDIATANDFSNDVSVLLGDGTGVFAAATSFAAASGAFSVAVGDLNSDGHQDLVSSNFSAFNLSFLQGNGMGSFAAPTNFGAGSQPFSVAVGDFNGDGRQDLVAANHSGSNISVLLRTCAATSPTPTNTMTNTPTNTSTSTPTNTSTNTPTATATFTPTPSNTPSNTATGTPTPSCSPVSLSIPDVQSNTGVVVTVPVNTSDLTGSGVFSIDMQVAYDPAVLAPMASCVTLGPVAGSSSLTANCASSGTVIISLFQANAMSGSGVLVDLHFNVIGEPGTSSPLNLTFPEGSCLTATNGSVTVVAGGPISGTVTYGNAIGSPNPRFVSNVLLSGVGSANVSTTSGFPGGGYSLAGFGSGSYTVTPTKTSGSNGITSFDAAKVAQHAAGVVLLTGNPLIVADVSGNGSVTSFDAGFIGKFVVGSPPYGSTGTWRFNPASRTYSSVTSSQIGEDYSALLMGEVSGNWTNTGARSVANSQRRASDASSSTDQLFGPVQGISVALPTIEAAPDKEIIIPVNVQGVANKGVISYEFNLSYDPSVIQPLAQPVDMIGTVSRGLIALTNTSEPGLLRVVVYGPLPIDENGLLLNLRFQAVGKDGSISPLTWERIMFNEGDPIVNAINGQIELK